MEIPILCSEIGSQEKKLQFSFWIIWSAIEEKPLMEFHRWENLLRRQKPPNFTTMINARFFLRSVIIICDFLSLTCRGTQNYTKSIRCYSIFLWDMYIVDIVKSAHETFTIQIKIKPNMKANASGANVLSWFLKWFSVFAPTWLLFTTMQTIIKCGWSISFWNCWSTWLWQFLHLFRKRRRKADSAEIAVWEYHISW